MLPAMTSRTLGFSTVAMIVTLVLAGGCANTRNQADRPAQDFLGLHAINVLAEPTSVEGWNYHAPDGTSYSDPAPKKLDMAYAAELRDILFDANTYAKPGYGGFNRSVGFRIFRGNQTVELLVSFSNDSLLIKTLGPTGQPVTTSTSAAGARDRLMALAKRAFPGQEIK